MSMTIDQLQIEIQAKSTNAASSIDALALSLGKLRAAVKGGAGLTTTTKQFHAFAQAVQAMQAPTQKIAELVAALKPLETIGKSNLGSALNQLKKIPEITAGLDDAKLSAFAAKIQQVTVAIRPLAAEMEKVSLGFSRLPANIQKAINANARLTASNKSTAFGFNMLAAKISIIYVATRRIASVIGGWIRESNDYVENLNLFTVAMGEHAESAQAYAEKVSELMGIDPSEWMRNQGIFNTLLTGFGVVADKAALMSKNLTQLGYDLSSFFNISFADSMQKLQSGISGELEPLRRLGYDLSQAKLEAIALSLGIDRSVSSMTQAEKAQLRYYAILTQVTTAQGDMARTLSAPANQLRILQAQATQAARALGNIFIPALNAVLPYAIAFLKVIRMVADALASLFGFSLPEIDYSGVNGLATSGEDAADALGDAAGNAKKLKGLLAGFDELNIIQQQDASGGAGKAGGAGGGDLGIKLPEYDFLGGLVESKIAKVFKDMQKWAKRLLPILKPIAAALAAIWATTQLAKFARWIKTLGGAVGTLGMALMGLAAGFAVGALVSYVANIVAAEKGMKWLGYAVTGVVVALGVLAVTLGIVKGSLNLVFTGIGLVVGAIAGLAIAQEQLLTEKVSEWFYAYGEGSITITQLADAYGKMADEIIARKQPIIDGFSAYEVGKESVAKTSQELGALLQSVQYNTDEIGKKLPEIKTAFDKLLTDTQSTLASLHDNIILSLAGATGEAYTAMGGDLAAIYSLLDETFGAADQVLADSKTRLEELYAQLSKGEGSSDAIIAEILELKGTIGSLTQDSIPEVDNFNLAVRTAFDGVNFEDADAVSEALAKFKEKTEAATEAINQGAAAELASITELERIAGVLGIELSPETKSLLEQYKAQIEKTRQADVDGINAEFESAASAISAGLLTSMQGIAEQASTDWNDLNWFEKWWNGGNEAAYVAKAMANYRRNVVTPTNDKLIEANGSIGSEVAGKTDSMIDEVMAALFSYSINGMGTYVSGFKTDTETAMEKPLADLGKFVNTGFSQGIKNNIGIAQDAARRGAQDVVDAWAEGQQSGSPAKKYIEQSLFAMQGLRGGINKNKYLVTDSLKSLLNSMLQMMEQFTSKIASALNDMLSNFASTMGSMSVGSSGSVNFSHMRASSIPRFAYGGYVDAGQLFIAREAGPEMVGTIGSRTAVANNDQIVAAVSAGVYEAVSAAMAGQNDDGQPIVIQLDGRTLYESNIKTGKKYGYGGFVNTAATLR